MEIGNRHRRRQRIKLDGDRDPELYPHTLQFYRIPPLENISLQEFEDFAVDRLKVLKAIETVGLRHVRGSKEYKEALQKEFNTLKQQGILKGLCKRWYKNKLSEDDYEDRRKDHISHFILRLAYCRSEDLRRWFIQQEVDLLRYRFNEEAAESIEAFLKINNFQYEPIPDEERGSILSQLAAASNNNSQVVERTNYYKVPFTEALDLVKNRRVYLSKGFAYVPQHELVVIILSIYRSNLSHSLVIASRSLPQLEEDQRLLPMLSHLSKRYLGQDYSCKKPTAGVITAGMIDGLSRSSFAPCMQQLQQATRREHHLRHWGRQQYGLFLKGIGVSLDEAMKYWRGEFMKLIDADKFDKQYSYNIRHNYGKEGKRADYTPYSCMKIITTNAPATGDYHGCPFKHTDADLLKQKLQSKGLSKEQIEEVVETSRKGHYQVACGKYFQYVYNCGYDFSPNHPNQYFDEAQKLVNEKAEGGQAKTPKSVIRTPARSSQSNTTITPSQATTDDFEDDPLSMEDMEKMMAGVEECT